MESLNAKIVMASTIPLAQPSLAGIMVLNDIIRRMQPISCVVVSVLAGIMVLNSLLKVREPFVKTCFRPYGDYGS